VIQEVDMDKEPEEPTGGSAEPTEEPPPFNPDPDLIAYLEHGGKPSEQEVREMGQKAQGQSATR
jgi:hypothetical protein